MTHYEFICDHAPAALVCLDLQRASLTRSVSWEAADRTAQACRGLIDHARMWRWPVLHVHRREASVEAARPIPGIEPWASEAVFQRSGPSAFSNPRFRERACELGGPLALIGFSLGGSVLATAFAAADLGLPVEIVRDAVLAEIGAPGAEAMVSTPLSSLAPLARILESYELFPEGAQRLAAANLP